MTSKGRSGLVSYGGESEISDSEDERGSVSTSPPEGGNIPTSSSDLGIPLSLPNFPYSPPVVPKPLVQSAPLVDYIEEDDEHNESKGNTSGITDDDAFHISNTDELSASEMNTSQGEDLSENSERKSEVPSIEISDDSQCIIPLFFQTANVVLPPEPATKCSKALQDKIISLLQKKISSGSDLNSSMNQRKDLRNPSIYEKLITFCNLDELGTNFPEHLYPKEWTEESYYDNLFKEQKKEHMQKERARIKYVNIVKKPAPATAATEPTKKPRRSKWDISTTGSGPESGGSRGTSPVGGRERAPLLGNAPIGMQPRVIQTGMIGAQAKAQASQLSKELSRAK